MSHITSSVSLTEANVEDFAPVKILEHLKISLRDWMSDKALPLWSGHGFNPLTGLFHERLKFDFSPVGSVNLRLMVQARQISTFCRAKIDGLFDFSTEALQALAKVESLYWRRDGDEGWIFSIDGGLNPADTKRDLYAHAFILFAYAWAFRLTNDQHYADVARKTSDELESLFWDGDAGLYHQAIPSPDNDWHQNPHMHLLEAYLALYEFTGDEFYFCRCQAIVDAVVKIFILPDTGFLLEIVGLDRQARHGNPINRIEPGHLFEWAWLLSEYNRLAPGSSGRALTIARSLELGEAGIRHGVIEGKSLVCDAIDEYGCILENTTRIWPQTEFIRFLMRNRGVVDDVSIRLACDHVSTFLDFYIPKYLEGGWIDRLDSSQDSIMDHMPASSLYHIYGAVSLCL